GVLFYSPRTARHFAMLEKAKGVSGGLSGTTASSLSAAMAAEMDMRGFSAIHISAEPSPDALLWRVSASFLGEAAANPPHPARNFLVTFVHPSLYSDASC